MSEEEQSLLEEDRLLRLYGLHLAYDAENAAEFPKEANPEGEVWQLGSSHNPVEEPQFFTREEALRYVEERRQNS
jgi:hypothetical protein